MHSLLNVQSKKTILSSFIEWIGCQSAWG